MKFLFQKEPSACSDGVLSDMMPDIAMATASMSLSEFDHASSGLTGDLELDLGDGNSHSGNGGATLYI